MPLWEELRTRLAAMRGIGPEDLKNLGQQRVTDLILQEISRSRARVAELEQRYPSAPARERAQRLIDGKKSVAGMVGGVSGVFGLAGVPADLLVMTWLQIILLVDVATVYKVNLKTARARNELLDVFAYANGIGPLQRSSPKVLGKLAGVLLERGGMKTLGRAVPLVAVPVTAYLNNQHIQTVGDEAIRFYEGWAKARQKTRSTAAKPRSKARSE